MILRRNVLASLVAGAVASHAFGVGIEEIVVTAQKREESLSEIPIAVSAFTGDTMADVGIQDTRDLGKLVPGFTVGDSGFGTPIYTMRGVGFNERTFTAQNNVGVYVDEVNLPFSINTKGPALDLSRTEVLKGPQGILYGRNTTGGAINYIVNKPTEEFEAGVKTSYGRYNLTDIEGFVSGSLSDNVAGRLAVRDIRQRDGDQKSSTRNDELGEKDKQAMRGQLEWTPTEDLLFRFMVDAWSDKSDARAPQAIVYEPQVPAGQAFIPQPSYPYPGVGLDDPTQADWPAPGTGLPTDVDWDFDDNQVLYAFRTEWDINEEVKLIGIASYMDLEMDNSNLPVGGLPYQHNDQEVNLDIETTAFELRLQGVLGSEDQFEWMVGANYSKDKADQFQYQRLYNNSTLVAQNFIPLFGADIFVDSTDQISTRAGITTEADIEQQAVFVNTAWHFAETLTLTVGGRYTEQEQDYYACNWEGAESVGAAVAIPGILPNDEFTLANSFGTVKGEENCYALDENFVPGPFRGTLEEDNFSYRVALDWQTTDDIMLYISYTQGYKAGGFPAAYAASLDQHAPVVQEKVKALEIGAKTFFADRQVQANVAIYDYDYTDKQLLTKRFIVPFGPLPVLDNAPEATVRGGELELNYAPDWAPGLYLSASAAYVDTEIDEFFGEDSRGTLIDLSGRPFNFSPPWEYTLLVNYEHSITDELNGFISADYTWSDETSAVLEYDPDYKMDSYGLFGGRVGVSAADETWRLMLYGRNLTDEYQPTGLANNGEVIVRWAGEGRSYGLTFEYNF